MRSSKEMLAVVAALAVVALAGLFFFYVQDYRSTDKLRVEEPYVRTENRPPSAVEDETSHPDLVD